MLGLLFPIDCVVCGLEGSWVCPECWENNCQRLKRRCFICKKLGENGLCKGCQKFTGLSELICGYSYKNPAIRELIIKAKYANYSNALVFLSQKFLDEAVDAEIDFDVVAYIPSSRNKFRERGFLQTKIIAEKLFRRNASVKILKVRETAAQAGLNKAARRENIKDSFLVKDNLRDKTVVVVDDVVTTGSTLKEAVRCLKMAGAKKVIGVTLAYD
ncbi:ComF family protein [Candidatus Berkelbacteria bacterium]|nr:ComF family protein [Candidatus Berkelbacteria bacterium]